MWARPPLCESVNTFWNSNYFEFADALAELKDTGCVVPLKTDSGINVYTITEKGKNIEIN